MCKRYCRSPDLQLMTRLLKLAIARREELSLSRRTLFNNCRLRMVTLSSAVFGFVLFLCALSVFITKERSLQF